MSEIKTVQMTKNISHDIWFQGKSSKNDSGAETYFICQYLDKTYYNKDTKEFYPFCKHKNIRVDKSSDVCNMDCDQYGTCATCAGFSAVRCQECEVPRP